ncbi:hypothetical protein C8F04DRAFT_1104541 [Mycena alexandri]|uniref:DNA replication complex GINS protein PSF1 n=1 Tax=Mycena alexandri TaxID=1745969 RepID=A0AAD6SSZ9_9AGAR|nr:hypothetical protein C8F04DRAFT_1104541 [Mycena alexandri]
MSETRQYGELGTQLVMESRRSTQTDTLLKYNDSLVRLLIREQRDLEKAAVAHVLASADADIPPPALMIIQTGPLSPCSTSIRAKLSPHEVDYLRSYHASVITFRSEFSQELDITASIVQPPKDLHVLVHVVRDCGVIQTESGSINFRMGHRFMVRRSDIEHLIVQGYLEEV